MSQKPRLDNRQRRIMALARALTQIRSLCRAGANEKAEAIADAVHVIPSLLLGEGPDLDQESLIRLYFEPVAVHEEIRELVDILREGA